MLLIGYQRELQTILNFVVIFGQELRLFLNLSQEVLEILLPRRKITSSLLSIAIHLVMTSYGLSMVVNQMTLSKEFQELLPYFKMLHKTPLSQMVQ